MPVKYATIHIPKNMYIREYPLYNIYSSKLNHAKLNKTSVLATRQLTSS